MVRLKGKGAISHCFLKTSVLEAPSQVPQKHCHHQRMQPLPPWKFPPYKTPGAHLGSCEIYLDVLLFLLSPKPVFLCLGGGGPWDGWKVLCSRPRASCREGQAAVCPQLGGEQGTDKINVFSIENTCMGLKRKK